jgi:RNA 3'-terminal phosphate cyclase (ATP)
MGVTAEIELVRWGFYPAGGGEVRAKVASRARPLRPLSLIDRGQLERVSGTAVAMNLPSHIAQRMSQRAHRALIHLGALVHVEPLRVRGKGPGAGVFLFARYEGAIGGFTAYGRKGLPAERVADAACAELEAWHNSRAPVDPHLADQLLLPMALADGRSELVTSRVTQHLLTNAWVVRQFVPADVRIEERADGTGRLVVVGSGQ